MRHSLILMTALLLACAAGAQEKPASSMLANTIYVGADGKYEASPDTAIIQFNISAQEAKSEAAYQRAAQAAEQVRQVLRANGVDPAAAEIGYFSLEPVYDYRDPKRKLVGYRVNTAATLKLRDFSKIAPIVQQLAEIDVTANQNLNYTLEKIDSAKKLAVEDGLRRARELAGAAAAAGGRAVAELSSASVDVFEPVVPIRALGMRKMSAEAAAPAPPTAEFTPQKITVTAHVNALFLLK